MVKSQEASLVKASIRVMPLAYLVLALAVVVAVLWPTGVSADDAPTITDVAPNTGGQGQTLSSVVITGTYLTGATLVSFGSGITVTGYTVDSVTQITASISIGPSAATGLRDVLVTTAGGTATMTGGFTVNRGLPTISSVSPDNGGQGQTLDRKSVV